MKRLTTLIALLCLATAQAAWAQPRPWAQGGGGGRNIEDRRGQRQEQRREPVDRRQPQADRQTDRQTDRNGQRNERAEGNDRNARGEPGRQRMMPEERRALRDQIRDHGRDIYRDPGKR